MTIRVESDLYDAEIVGSKASNNIGIRWKVERKLRYQGSCVKVIRKKIE